MGSRHRGVRSLKAPAPVYSVYAVELREEVWECDSKFRKANPNGSLDCACVYVGYSAKTPAERLAVHRLGGRYSSKIVVRYGSELRPDLYVDVPLVRTTRAEAEAEERALADRLRRMGYRVWQR